jgi:parvulin-like peptidyl-prolyl isomerase
MAKSSKKRKALSAETKQTKKQLALGRKEARQNRIILILVGLLAAIVVIILAVGIVRELVLKPSSPVATVNGEKLTTADYQNLVTYNRYNYYNNLSQLEDGLEQMRAEPEENAFLISFYEQQLGQVQTALTLAPQDAVEELIDAELARQKAEQLGIEVSAQEVDQAIEDDFRGALTQQAQQPITGTEELPTPTPVSQADVDDLYDRVIDAMKISDSAFRTIVRRTLLLEKVQDTLAAEVPTTGLVADVQLIKTETEDEALSAKERIEGGEDFAIVAQEVSTDTLTVEDGGAVGLVAPGQLSGRYGAALDTYVFSLSAGELGLVESDGMFYVVLVVNRDENGPLPEEILSQRQNSALTDWLEEQKNSPDVEIERLLKPGQIPPDPFAPYFGY